MALKAAFMVPHPPLIIPHVGRGGEAQIAGTSAAYGFVAGEIARLKPETIIIISPHTAVYADYFHIAPGKGATGSFGEFGAPDIHFEETYDRELADRIADFAAAADLQAGPAGETDPSLDHGTMVPLWFIRRRYNDFKIVRIGVSGLPMTEHYALGYLIRAAVEAEGRSAVLIASGDLSHKLKQDGPYGFSAAGPEYDRTVMDICGRGAFRELFDIAPGLREKAAECGHRGIMVLAGALDGLRVESKALSYQDDTGIGYGICAFYPKEEDTGRHFLAQFLAERAAAKKQRLAREDAYVRIARASLESALEGAVRTPVPRPLPADLTGTRAGVYVSLYRDGEPRGCFGTVYPSRETLAEEIASNAVGAALRDPGSEPVTAQELDDLAIRVDVLLTPVIISSAALLDAEKYGVIVSSGRKAGLMLPGLPGVNTPEEQVAAAMQKGGIGPDEEVTVQRFGTICHR